MNTETTTGSAERSGKKAGAAHKAAQLVSLYNPKLWKEKGIWWTAGLFVLTYLVVVVLLGIYWSQSPDEFNVRDVTLEYAGQEENLVTGSYTTAVGIQIADTLLDKPGGYLSNDITPPGVYLDNIPNWEFGALTALRDLTDSLRNRLSRSQSQSQEDEDLQIAEPQFNYDSESWIFPSTESEYRKGRDALRAYFDRLSQSGSDRAQFFARADNLAAYLEVVEMRLGGLANRLSQAVGKKQYNTALAGEASAERSSPAPQDEVVKTPWLEIDDALFEARGYAWGVLHVLEAVQVDFNKVLHDKNANVSVKQIVRELRETQNTLWTPWIMNGTGFGPLANHSLIMASYLSRANAGVIDLRRLLREG